MCIMCNDWLKMMRTRLNISNRKRQQTMLWTHMLHWVVYVRMKQTHLKRIQKVHQITHWSVAASLKHRKVAIFAFPTAKVKAKGCSYFYERLFPISASPCHMTTANLQGRKTTLVGFTTWALEKFKRDYLNSPWPHARTQTHIVQEIIINSVELEPIEQPITAQALSYSKHFYL